MAKEHPGRAELVALEAAGASPAEVAAKAFQLETLEGITRPETALAVGKHLLEVMPPVSKDGSARNSLDKVVWMTRGRIAPCFDAAWYRAFTKQYVWGTWTFHKHANKLAERGIRGQAFDVDAMELTAIAGTPVPKDYQVPNVSEFLKAAGHLTGRQLAQITNHFGMSREVGKVLKARKNATPQALDFFAYATGVWDMAWPTPYWDHLVKVRGHEVPPSHPVVGGLDGQTATAEFWLWFSKSTERWMRATAYRWLDYHGAKFEISLPDKASETTLAEPSTA